MRKFNPEKELKKIQYGNKNKVILGVCLLLLIITIGSSYALYQIKYNKRIIYTTVDNFYQNDVSLSVYIDGIKKVEPNSFPDKDSGKIFSHIKCENGGTGYFDNTKWELNLKTTEQDRCDVYFVTGNLPNPPELYQGMIPVIYGDNGIMYVADTDSDWYNYQDHRWGNAVLVDASNETIKNKYFKEDNQLREDIVGKEVPMEEVLQMYVWVPRYKYQLFNVTGTSKVPEQMINIKFEEGIENTGDITCKYTNNNDGTITESCLNKEGEPASNGEWYTHPAFTFKGTLEESGTELKGIWVGKYEASGKYSSDLITDLKIIPNVSSLRGIAIAYMFQGVRDIEEKYSENYNINSNEIDTHMMKNIEWGAVAYLTQSKYGRFNGDGSEIADGAEVWINNDTNFTTGCAGSSVFAESGTCTDEFRWNKSGVKASTTGNMYGIYDMSGGASEPVMGNIVNTDGTFYPNDAKFDDTSSVIVPNPAAKYYDIYTYGTSLIDIIRGHLGDATKETQNWYGVYTWLPTLNNPWVLRGGYYGNTPYVGPFNSNTLAGWGYGNYSFRSVLTVQDGEE